MQSAEELSIWHSFLLIPEAGHDDDRSSYSNYFDFANTYPDKVVLLDDDLIWYMHDTLMWIPTSSPDSQATWRGFGLNRTGPTIINKAGAEIARRIFGVWANLLANGPAAIELRGVWTETLNNHPEHVVAAGGYSVIHLDRDTYVDRLRKLELFAKQASDDQFVILHLGI